MDNRPIGMFDSGVGGITVLEEIRKELPNENIVYLGDTKRFPYGSKSKEAIIELTKNGIDFLINKNVKLIVIACGTASSQALDEVKNLYNVPIIGIINPTVKYLKQNKIIKKIGVIATLGAIKSKSWQNTLSQNFENVEIRDKACPLLAPLAEEGWTDNDIAKLTIKEYLKDIKDIDTLILGCTHYPLFKNVIEAELNNSNINIINTGVMVAKEVNSILSQNDALSTSVAPNYNIYITDIEGNSASVINRIMKNNNENITNLNINLAKI